MSSLHPQVVKARAFLAEARAKARALHDSGGGGFQVCSAWTDDVDEAVIGIIHAALNSLSQQPEPTHFAFVALGGYGRRDLAPYSDIDLMLLYRGSESRIAPLARLIGQMVVDAGLQLGFSVRTIRQAKTVAWTDATALTSFVEMRFIEGHKPLFDSFEQAIVVGCKIRSSGLVKMIEAERLSERQKYNETGNLLHPNVKRSRGCLRDVQLVRWVGFVCFGERSPEQLANLGLLAREDYQTIQTGYQYLLRLRNQLHFTAGRTQDTLDRSKQMSMAAWAGCHGEEGVLPVEQFMQQFFEITSEVRYCSANFAGVSQARVSFFRTLARYFGMPIAAGIRLGLREIWATKAGLEQIKSDPARVLELMQLASRFNRRIAHTTWRTIRETMLRRQGESATPDAIARFLEILCEPRRLGDVLRRLHELRVIEQIIPAMRHARCLLQFNEYHKYTVDTHCIRAVEAACDFAKDDSVLGRVYRGIKNKRILHLALLLHDLGKGFIEDHSQVGRVLAEQTAERLGLSDADRDLLVFLVHQHLLMTHTAFRFDLSQKTPAVQFAKAVGSIERLQHMLVLSCADLAAVGPGALNDWKLNLILQLYDATEAQFRSESPDQRFLDLVNTQRKQVFDFCSQAEKDDPWWAQNVAQVPAGYLLNLKPKLVAEELRKLRSLSPEKPSMAWGQYIPDRRATEYVVAVKQTRSTGLFHRIVGGLSSSGLSILSAEIHTQPGMLAWDRFVVEDPDYEDAPPQFRIDEVCANLIAAVDPNNNKSPVFRRIWNSNDADTSTRVQPTQIRFDNATSDQHTIISVFAYDRIGLLYDIARTLYQLDLDLQVAKVSTHLDQVVDVFYVTDASGNKLLEPTLLYTLRQNLLKAIEET